MIGVAMTCKECGQRVCGDGRAVWRHTRWTVGQRADGVITTLPIVCDGSTPGARPRARDQ